MVTLYTQKENGDLKFVAEVEDVDDPGAAVEALLEENPRTRADEFVALVGDVEDGQVVTVRQVEQVTYGWGVSGNGNGADEEDEAPAPRRRGRPKGSTNKPKRGPGRPKGSTNKAKSAGGGGRRGRQATLTEDVLEEAMNRINDGETVKAVAADLGVSSSGYLARRIREEFGDDAIQVTRGRPAAGGAAPAAKPKRGPGRPAGKRGPGRPKGSTNKVKAAGAKRGPGRPKGSKNKVKATSGRKSSPFKARAEED